jgi:hypothetical protein
MNIILNDSIIDAIDARYYELGGDYYGRDSIVQFANITIGNGFVGSVAEFIEDVASELRQND